MPLYSYKCDTCGKTEDKFRRVEDREKEFECEAILINGKFDYFVRPKGIEQIKCPGTMRFQPVESMRGGSFKMHDPTEREAQYGSGDV